MNRKNLPRNPVVCPDFVDASFKNMVVNNCGLRVVDCESVKPHILGFGFGKMWLSGKLNLDHFLKGYEAAGGCSFLVDNKGYLLSLYVLASLRQFHQKTGAFHVHDKALFERFWSFL